MMEAFRSRFAENPDVFVQDEPLNKFQNYKGFNMLNLFYENQERYGYQFQVVLLNLSGGGLSYFYIFTLVLLLF